MDICVICLDNNANYQLCRRCYVCRYHLPCITDLRNLANDDHIKCPTCRENLRYQRAFPIIEQLPLFTFSSNPRVVRQMQVEAEIHEYIRLVEDYIMLDGENLLDRFSHFGPFNDNQYRLLNIAVNRQLAYNQYKTFMHIMYSIVVILSMLVPAVNLVLLDEVSNTNCNITLIKCFAYISHASWLGYLALFFKIKIKNILITAGIAEIIISSTTIIMIASYCMSYSMIILHACKILMWAISTVIHSRRRIAYENQLARFSYVAFIV